MKILNGSAAVELDAENNLDKARREKTKSNGAGFSFREKGEQQYKKIHLYP